MRLPWFYGIFTKNLWYFHDKLIEFSRQVHSAFTMNSQYFHSKFTVFLWLHGDREFIVKISWIHREFTVNSRLLGQEIFNDNTLKVCSLNGARPKSFYGTQVRLGPDQHARRVLLTYIKRDRTKQGWSTYHTQAITISLSYYYYYYYYYY